MLGCGGATAADALRCAQVRKAANQTTADYSAALPGAAISFDTVVFDNGGFYSGGAPTRLTIPSALNGHYVVVSMMVQLNSVTGSSVMAVTLSMNGSASFVGNAGMLRSSGAGVNNVSDQGWIQARTHAIQVASGDYFEAMLHCADSSVTVTATNTFFEVYDLGPTLTGALAYVGSSITTQNYSTPAALPFNSEAYDSDAFHDNVTNNSQIVIPSAVNGRYAILKGSSRLSLVSGNQQASLEIKKGGASFLTGAIQNVQNGVSGSQWIDIETPPFVVSTGEVYTLVQFSQDTSVTLDGGAGNTAFSIQILPVGFQGVLAQLSGNATADYRTPTALSWAGTDVYDTDAAHDPSGSPTQIIVPAAWNGKYAVLTAHVTGTGDLTANLTSSVGILRGASPTYDGFGGFGGHNGGATGAYLAVRSSIVQLTAGQAFTASYFNNTDASSTIAAAEATFGLRVLG